MAELKRDNQASVPDSPDRLAPSGSWAKVKGRAFAAEVEPRAKPALIASRMRTAKPGAPAAVDGPEYGLPKTNLKGVS